MNMGGDMGHMMHARGAPEQPGQQPAPVNATDAQQQQARNVLGGPAMGHNMGQPMGQNMGHQMGQNMGHQMGQNMGGGMNMGGDMGHMMHARRAPEQPGQNQAPVNATEAQQHQVRNSGMAMGGGMGQQGGHGMGMGSGMPQQPMGGAMGMDSGMGHMMHARAAPAQPIGVNASDAQHQQQARSAPDQVPAQASNATQDHQQQARSIPQEQPNQVAPNGSDVHQQHLRSLPLAPVNQSQDLNREARGFDKVLPIQPNQPQPVVIMPQQPTEEDAYQRNISPKFGRMADQIYGYFQ